MLQGCDACWTLAGPLLNPCILLAGHLLAICFDRSAARHAAPVRSAAAASFGGGWRPNAPPARRLWGDTTASTQARNSGCIRGGWGLG